MALADRIIGAESAGNPNAKNPRSSASGLGQFIDSTWLAMIQKHRPDLAQSMDKQSILALKSDPTLSREMTNAYAADNSAGLRSAGYEPTPGNAYLAHFAGLGGAQKVLGADPTTPVSQILDPAAVQANPFLQKMTAGDLAAWAASKVGGAATEAPAQAPAPEAPMQLAGAAPAYGADTNQVGLLAQTPQAPQVDPFKALQGLLAPQQPQQQEAPQRSLLAPPQGYSPLQFKLAQPQHRRFA